MSAHLIRVIGPVMLVIGALLPSARAQQSPAAPRAGFSGRISLGALFASANTNMTASTSLNLLRLGATSLTSLDDKPKASSGVLPLVTTQLNYAFAGTGTELFFGSWNNADATQFDNLNQGGVRQTLGGAGKVSLAYMFGLPNKTWADPYVVGAERAKTSRWQQGARLAWENILGSAFQFDYAFRHISIASEHSGAFLGLSLDDARLLSRAGNVHQLDVSYPVVVARAHQIVPTVTYRREALQGDAMSAQTVDLKLRYVYGTRAYALIFDGSIGRSQHDDVNPVFAKTQKDVRYGVGTTGVLRQPFGLESWSLFVTATYVNHVSNIDFYSAGLVAIGGGATVEF